MPKYSSEEWEEILVEARSFNGSILHRAIIETLEQDRQALLTDLDSEKTDFSRTQITRGVRKGLKRGIDVVDDILQRATRSRRKE